MKAEQVKEAVSAIRVGSFLESLARDLRFAFGTLAKAPAFIAVVVLTLALGTHASNVERLFLRSGLQLTTIAVAIGLPGPADCI